MREIVYSMVLMANILVIVYFYRAIEQLKLQRTHLNSLVQHNNTFYKNSIDDVASDLVMSGKKGPSYGESIDSFLVCHPLEDTSLLSDMTPIAQFEGLQKMAEHYTKYYDAFALNLHPSWSEVFAYGVLNDKEDFIQFDFYRKERDLANDHISMNLNTKNNSHENNEQSQFNYDEKWIINSFDLRECDRMLKQRWDIPIVQTSK